MNQKARSQFRPSPKPTSAIPGTSAKIDLMAARYGAGEHIHNQNDADMDQERVVRVPIIEPKNHIVGWEIVDESEYRKSCGPQATD